MKTVKLGDIINEAQVDRILALNDVNKIREEIIIPLLPEINRITGQENDAQYWAYLVHYHLCLRPKAGLP